MNEAIQKKIPEGFRGHKDLYVCVLDSANLCIIFYLFPVVESSKQILNL